MSENHPHSSDNAEELYTTYGPEDARDENGDFDSSKARELLVKNGVSYNDALDTPNSLLESKLKEFTINETESARTYSLADALDENGDFDSSKARKVLVENGVLSYKEALDTPNVLLKSKFENRDSLETQDVDPQTKVIEAIVEHGENTEQRVETVEAELKAVDAKIDELKDKVEILSAESAKESSEDRELAANQPRRVRKLTNGPTERLVKYADGSYEWASTETDTTNEEDAKDSAEQEDGAEELDVTSLSDEEKEIILTHRRAKATSESELESGLSDESEENPSDDTSTEKQDVAKPHRLSREWREENSDVVDLLGVLPAIKAVKGDDGKFSGQEDPLTAEVLANVRENQDAIRDESDAVKALSEELNAEGTSEERKAEIRQEIEERKKKVAETIGIVEEAADTELDSDAELTERAKAAVTEFDALAAERIDDQIAGLRAKEDQLRSDGNEVEADVIANQIVALNLARKESEELSSESDVDSLEAKDITELDPNESLRDLPAREEAEDAIPQETKKRNWFKRVLDRLNGRAGMAQHDLNEAKEAAAETMWGQYQEGVGTKNTRKERFAQAIIDANPEADEEEIEKGVKREERAFQRSIGNTGWNHIKNLVKEVRTKVERNEGESDESFAERKRHKRRIVIGAVAIGAPLAVVGTVLAARGMGAFEGLEHAGAPVADAPALEELPDRDESAGGIRDQLTDEQFREFKGLEPTAEVSTEASADIDPQAGEYTADNINLDYTEYQSPDKISDYAMGTQMDMTSVDTAMQDMYDRAEGGPDHTAQMSIAFLTDSQMEEFGLSGLTPQEIEERLHDDALRANVLNTINEVHENGATNVEIVDNVNGSFYNWGAEPVYDEAGNLVDTNLIQTETYLEDASLLRVTDADGNVSYFNEQCKNFLTEIPHPDVPVAESDPIAENPSDYNAENPSDEVEENPGTAPDGEAENPSDVVEENPSDYDEENPSDEIEENPKTEDPSEYPTEPDAENPSDYDEENPGTAPDGEAENPSDVVEENPSDEVEENPGTAPDGEAENPGTAPDGEAENPSDVVEENPSDYDEENPSDEIEENPKSEDPDDYPTEEGAPPAEVDEDQGELTPPEDTEEAVTPEELPGEEIPSDHDAGTAEGAEPVVPEEREEEIMEAPVDDSAPTEEAPGTEVEGPGSDAPAPEVEAAPEPAPVQEEAPAPAPDPAPAPVQPVPAEVDEEQGETGPPADGQ